MGKLVTVVIDSTLLGQLLDSAQVRAEQLNGEQLLIREAIAKIEAQL